MRQLNFKAMTPLHLILDADEHDTVTVTIIKLVNGFPKTLWHERFVNNSNSAKKKVQQWKNEFQGQPVKVFISVQDADLLLKLL